LCSGRRSGLLAVVFICAALSGTPAIADRWAQFKPEAAVHGQVLPLRGTSRLVWMRIVTVYDAALYLPAEVPRTDSLTDVPKRLDLRYHVSIKAKKFGESAETYLEKNVTPEALARLRPRIEQINRLYRDVKEGDRYTLSYAPGNGTTLSLNNEPLGTIEGADFAAAYYTIWLGANPISDSMRDELTGTTARK
jgi:hypothetical protein